MSGESNKQAEADEPASELIDAEVAWKETQIKKASIGTWIKGIFEASLNFSPWGK